MSTALRRRFFENWKYPAPPDRFLIAKRAGATPKKRCISGFTLDDARNSCENCCVGVPERTHPGRSSRRSSRCLRGIPRSAATTGRCLRNRAPASCYGDVRLHRIADRIAKKSRWRRPRTALPSAGNTSREGRNNVPETVFLTAGSPFDCALATAPRRRKRSRTEPIASSQLTNLLSPELDCQSQEDPRPVRA